MASSWDTMDLYTITLSSRYPTSPWTPTTSSTCTRRSMQGFAKVGFGWSPTQSSNSAFTSWNMAVHPSWNSSKWLVTSSQKGISKPPASFVANAKLSTRATFLLWNGLATSTHSCSTMLCIVYIQFASTTLCLTDPLPASTVALIKWAGQHHSTNKTYHSVKHNLTILKSWHINLGLSTTSFDDACLTQVLQGYK
ncbi:uncharacterized protein UBRO2_05970 [Ustilago bromivora]|uniref:Uncharacterized protein n=1 Tax=Ustilago bromivora TaxID=307758 RepID=A0A8H8TWH5_9BASI|nr:uncharacterized protein UBRO2_05970 [Ustilago bromivora]